MDCTCTNPWHFVVTYAVGYVVVDSDDSVDADGMHPCRDHFVGPHIASFAFVNSAFAATVVVDRNSNQWADSVAIASYRRYSIRYFHALNS